MGVNYMDRPARADSLVRDVHWPNKRDIKKCQTIKYCVLLIVRRNQSQNYSTKKH